MKAPSRRETGIALFFFALAGLALLPAFWPDQPCGHDLAAHLYRITQKYLNLAEGGPFSLWGRHFMRGYGYAIFPYYAPALYWAGALLRLVGLEASAALRLLTWLGLVVAGGGAYRLGRLYFSLPAAFLAGLAYQFSPYLLYDAVERAAVPELLGLALLPWFLAALELALDRPSRRRAAAAGLWLALIFLTHNIIPLLGVALGLGLGLVRLAQRRPLLPPLGGLAAVLAIGFGASLFFWLPAYVELADTQVRLAEPLLVGWPQYDRFFVPFRSLAAWPARPYDPALNNPAELTGLSPATLLLAALGLAALGLAVIRPGKRGIIAYWGGATLAALFLAAPQSAFLWEMLPLPQFVQIPFRFLGPAALGAALLAGAGLEALLRPLIRFPRAALLLGIAAGTAVGGSGFYWTYAPSCSYPAPRTAADVAAGTVWNEAGQVSRWGGGAIGETLPRWVTALPDPDRYAAAYEGGEAVQRLQLPETGRLESWRSRPGSETYLLTLAEPAVLIYGAFYHPRWRVAIDGRPLSTGPAGPAALLSFEAPAGRHELTLRFTPSPLRQVARAISGLLLLAVGFWALREKPGGAGRLPLPGRTDGLLMALTVLVLLGGRLLIDRTDNLIRAERLVDGRLEGVTTPTAIDFSGEFRHLGFDGPAAAPADAPLHVTQYWMPINEIGAVYGFGLRLADDEGRVWSLPGERPAGQRDFPGSRGWITGEYVQDGWLLPLLPGIPPGDYWLEAEAFRRDPPFALTPDRQVGVDPAWARLGRVGITGGSPPEQADYRVGQLVEPPAALAAGIFLRGWTAPEASWRPGERPVVDLLWLVEPNSLPAEEAELRLRTAAGERVAARPFSPIWGGSPQTESVLLRDRLPWPLPAGLPGGRLRLFVALDEREIPLGDVTVELPERRFDKPAPQIPIGERFDFARLVGADLSPGELAAGGTLSLVLYWEGASETTTRYRVFVHLRDEAGEIVAQADGEPAGWSRPTSGWLPGEIIADAHVLQLPADLPAGGYTLVAGLYTPAGGAIGEAVLADFR